MTDETKEQAIIQVLAERFENQRLPRALALKEEVDRGETLAELDIMFLDEVFQDAKQLQPLLDRHPEWQPLAAQMMHLYKEITDRALQNEKAKSGSS